MPERHRILIVDDDAADRQAVAQALLRESTEIDGVEADVLEVETIAGAREAIGREEFSCIFLDHDLPDGTSLDFLMEVRAQGLTTPVIVLTGRRDEQAITEVMRAGAVDYLPKERLHPDLVARSLRAALLFRRSQREKEAALAEMRGFQFIADRAADTFFLMDAGGHFVYVNQAACRSLGYTADQFRGLRVPDVDPLHQDAEYQALFQRAQGEPIPAFKTIHRRADGTTFPVEVSVTRLDVGGRSLLFASGRDISERTRVEEALRQSEARYRAVFEALVEGITVQDATGLWQEANGSAERILALSREQMAGRTSADPRWRTVYEDGSPLPGEEHPPMVALRTGQAVRDMLMGIHRPDGRFAWLSANAELIVDPATGEPTGVVTSFFDITAQRQAAEALRQSEERYRLLVEGATDYAMILMDPQGCITSWNSGAERIMGWSEPEVLGQPADLIFTPEDRAAGVPARELSRAAAEGRALNLRWHLTRDGARFYADGITEALYGGDGRLRGFAIVLRDATGRKALEDERSRFVSLADNSTDFIGMSDLDDVPFYVNPAGLRLVGLADMDQARAARGIEFFHEADRPFILGDLVPRVLRDGHGHAEVRLRHFGTGAPIWVNYTLLTLTGGDGRPVGLATVSRDITERKALEAERARLAEREHNIAQQLQAALQPELPRQVPGLALARYYEAALEESEGVGGDFYDAFAVEKGRTALAVGDLSGKGLAAAAQVATVRNMLRAFLYTRTTLAEAVTELNAVLAENGLLTGFTTLFVAAYDAGERALRYVNCGQEPALVRRAATGRVEHLPPTGPILGTFEGGRYAEETVTLARGDALAIFSDGLTEIGPSRVSMLGVEGVEALFGRPVSDEEALDAAELAERLALGLIAGVDQAAAGGVTRDDVCLLVAVVE